MNNGMVDKMQSGSTIQRKYRIVEQIGEGSFSKVYKGVSLKTSEPVAIKMEKPIFIETTDKGKDTIRILKRETTILYYLGRGCDNVPKIHWFGNVYSDDGTPISCLVIPYYDYSLYDWVKQKPLEERIAKIASIRTRMIDILRQVHSKEVIHRDIKPHNFMVRDGDIYLIDFGLAVFYRDGNGLHIEDAKNTDVIKPVVGSPTYISLFVHIGHTPSRRDDMISLEYVCLWLRGEMNDFAEMNETQLIERKREQLASASEESTLKHAYKCGFIEPPYYV